MKLLNFLIRHSQLRINGKFSLAALLLMNVLVTAPSFTWASDTQSSIYTIFSDPNGYSFVQLYGGTSNNGPFNGGFTISLQNDIYLFCSGQVTQPSTLQYKGGGPSGLSIKGTIYPNDPIYNPLYCYTSRPITTISFDLNLVSPVLYETNGHNTLAKGAGSGHPNNTLTKGWSVPCCSRIGSGTVCIDGQCTSVNQWDGIYDTSVSTTVAN